MQAVPLAESQPMARVVTGKPLQPGHRQSTNRLIANRATRQQHAQQRASRGHGENHRLAS